MSRRRSFKGPYQDIVDAALEQEWRVERTSKNQIQFFPPPPSKVIITASGTPSDWRAIKNLLSHLRREGFRYHE